MTPNYKQSARILLPTYTKKFICFILKISWGLSVFEGIALGVGILSLTIIVWLVAKISGLRNTMSDLKNKMDLMAAPAETLTGITTSLQNNVGTLNTAVIDMTKSIGEIKEQATKIETLGRKYEETEGLTRRIYSIMIGSYEKGRSGENYLRNMMNELLKIGIVRENVHIGTKIVEYCVTFRDGKLLPIDSKVVATQDVEKLFDENTTEQQRDELKKKIKSSLGRKVNEVCQYIDPQTTLPCAVMAIPDSLVDLSSEIVPEAVRSNVMVAGYSAVPQLIVYFVRVHSFYEIQEDVAELKDRLLAIQQKLSTIDDNFFANKFDRPMKMLNNATLQVRQIIGSVSGLLFLSSSGTDEIAKELE